MKPQELTLSCYWDQKSMIELINLPYMHTMVSYAITTV
jgi:hypothetical protein